MSTFTVSYKVLRSIFFTAIIAVASLYIILYVGVSIPWVQQRILKIAQREVAGFLGSRVEIDTLNIYPFKEIKLTGLKIYDLNNSLCLKVDELGAGIDLKALLGGGKIALTYAEIIGLDGRIYQVKDGDPLNIDFIIEAFAPKDKNKPPTKFDLRLHNVVIRKSKLSFDRLWKPFKSKGIFDASHIKLYDLKADVILPRLKNDDFIIDCRRLTVKEKSGIDIRTVKFRSHITSRSLSVNSLLISLPGTNISPSDFSINFNGFNHIKDALFQGTHRLVFVDNPVTPADFSPFLPVLSELKNPIDFSLDLEGNMKNVLLKDLTLSSQVDNMFVSLNTLLENPTELGSFFAKNVNLRLKGGSETIALLDKVIGNKANGNVFNILGRVGNFDVKINGDYNAGLRNFSGNGVLITQSGDIDFNLSGSYTGSNDIRVGGEVNLSSLELGRLLDSSKLGAISLSLSGDGEVRGKSIDGKIDAFIGSFIYNGLELGDISVKGGKNGNDVGLRIDSDNPYATFNLQASAMIAPEERAITTALQIKKLNLNSFGLTGKYSGVIYGDVEANLHWLNLDNISGLVTVHNAGVNTGKRKLQLDNLRISSYIDESDENNIFLDSDWFRAEINGDFTVKGLVNGVNGMLHSALPSVIRKTGEHKKPVDARYDIRIFGRNSLLSFLDLPVALGSDMTIKGNIDSGTGYAICDISAPYIIQNKKKIIRNTHVIFNLSDNRESILNVSSTLPVKNGEADINLKLDAFNDRLDLDAGWNVKNDKAIYGNLLISSQLNKNPLSAIPDVELRINPSVFSVSGADWNIDPAQIRFSDNILSVDDMKIWHEGQYLEILGKASASKEDEIKIKLNDINLDFIFNTLNINYVSFGGQATGEITGSSLFSSSPQAATKFLNVSGLSYNGAVLGDASISSRWDNNNKKVGIFADIKEGEERRALVDGGIWVTRDSLSFDMEANKVNASFLQPFMSAFTSDFGGIASGKVKLYGSFKDIDLVGRAYADSVRMKVDYTNVYYSGSDSIFLDKGHIIIPSFRLYDKDGNSALLTGNLYHSYFHNPEFEFKLSDASNLLCYDVNASINPDWYGTIYGNGSAVLRGRPGIVTMVVDMTTAPKSTFTFVLSDTQEAADYKFLTFSDRRKEMNLKKKINTDSSPIHDNFFVAQRPTVFDMDLRGSITPDAQMTLVMDPKAGDKITARGEGNLQIGYNTESDAMTMYGKYTLEEGNYNFSLQDLILRDFIIKRGSSISFNGDPLQAMLNISATYRVNTNLSDLDKSFSYDRELNRTNVPVDAVLNVNGDMQNPNITFDIELPTLTQDIVRKVKSVISTDDMMNRQIIYLLALNRFYTPEYMGQSGGGGELASVASSTISSQLSNIMGQLTDKFSVAPSFRSDKGDFSDMEVDVALSSRLLNNRLLINGNFGYRDKNTSSTTFVGDFDIEYLLSKSGNLRLKAYNHFNDQNYYLRSSLTTQGIGVVYRRDFDNPFSFLHRRRKQENPKVDIDSQKKEVNGDSLGINDVSGQ